MERYESPKMVFEEIRLNEEIANTCWGLASSGASSTVVYYDFSGKGWIEFTVAGDNCKQASNLTANIVGYVNVDSEDQNNAYTEFLNWWENTGSNGGSPFKGGSVYSESEPSGWS
ncbi:MAG: hypothetical protein ACI4PU_04760 [Intestinibacter sp.]